MKLIDIHSHMDYKELDLDRERIVLEMRKNDISTISNTLSWENYTMAKSLLSKFSDVIEVIPGLYPQDAEKMSDYEIDEYLNYISKIKPLAIGEVGLDKKWTSNKELFNKQKEVFNKLIKLAINLNIPIIIHTRKAETEVLDCIAKSKELYPNYDKYILHCFMGNREQIKRVADLDISCSVPLVVLNNKSIKNLVKTLKVTKLLVETDSPFLNTEKGQSNTPLNIPRIYNAIAEVKGFDKLEIKNIIYNNYMRLFM